MALATYAVVFDGWPIGLVLQDAAAYKVDGAVVEAVEGAPHADHIGVGDLVARVNNVSVLGMAYADVAALVGSSRSPRVLEFVPSHLRVYAQRVVDELRGQYAAAAEEPSGSIDEEELLERLLDHQHAILKTGTLLLQDRSAMGSSVACAWHSWHVVLRLAGLTYAAKPNAVNVVGDLSFVGRQCTVRALPPSIKSDETGKTEGTKQYAVELIVDGETLVMACASESEQSLWMEALTFAIDASNMIDRREGTVSQYPDGTAKTEAVLKLRAGHAAQLWRLRICPPKPLDDTQYQQAKRFAKLTKARLDTINQLKESHVDPLIQQSLRDEYDRLTYDERVGTAAIDKYEDAERRWEESNADENRKALLLVRRCLPIDCRTMSEAELTSMPSPRGLFMSTEMARKLKATAVLGLLRSDPKDIRWCDPSALTDLQVAGLSLLERRAIHAHLYQLSVKWQSNYGKWSYESFSHTKRKWRWFKALRDTFRCVVAAYDRHIKDYGPPGKHEFATDEEPDKGCPLRGAQCPVRAELDSQAMYELDLGYPEGDVFTTRKLDAAPTRASIIHDRSRGFDGFMAAPAADLLGASNFWMNPKLLGLRIEGNELSLGDRLTPSINIEGRHSPTEVYTGLYRGERVAVKRLTLVGQKTFANAAELVTVAKGLRQLQHRNLVSLLGLSWHKAQDIQVVTPLAARSDLRSLLDSSDAPSLTWDDFKCQVALDVVSALDYLHGEGGFAGMGALTSWNILLDADNRAQVNLLQLPHRDLESARDRVRSPLRWLAPR